MVAGKAMMKNKWLMFVLFLALGALIFAIFDLIPGGLDFTHGALYRQHGFPLAYEQTAGPCPPTGPCYFFNPANFAVDLAVALLISAAIILVAKKVVEK